MKDVRRARRESGIRAVWATAAILLAGCGAQDLYEPPEVPYPIVGRLELPSEAQGVDVLGDYAYIAAGQAGLLVIDISDPTNPELVLILDTVKFAESIRVASTLHTGNVVDIAFVVEGTEGVTTYDITSPENAFSFQQGTTAVDGNGLFIELPEDPADPYVVYLAESWKGLRIFESDPTIPGLLAYNGVFSSTRGYAKSVTVKDGYAFVADDEMGLAVLDVRDRTLGTVRTISACDTRGNARGVAMYGEHVFVADYENGLVVMEIREDDAVPTPHIVGDLELPGRCRAINVRDDMALIAAQDGGVHFVDVSNPASPEFLGRIITTYATDVAIAKSGLIVVTDSDEGLIVIDTGAPFPDTIAPSAVTDLSATGINVTTVRLEWSSPGDDGFSGTASQYDIRYADSPMTSDSDWENAVQAAGEPRPGPYGTAETFDVTGLAAGVTYHFALRTGDVSLNWSELSNVASATTSTGNVVPTLRDGMVTPEGGTADSTYVFEVTYEDGDGDAPTIAEVNIDGDAQDMVFVSGDYSSGALFRYETMLLPGSEHEYSFTFGDGVNDPITTDTMSGPWVGVTSFLMGSPTDESGRDGDETQHPVVLTDLFWISDHEVTQSEYVSLMGANPSRFDGVNLPVESVTWFDAVEYCNARSLDEGFAPAYTIDGETVTWDRDADGYRLPTEAEWEAACRGGSSSAFSGGDLTDEACGLDPVLDGLGWYCGNAGPSTHDVMTKQANDWDLHDMHGNVWEWCWDWYKADLGAGLAVDPAGPGGGAQRTVRGGSWYYFARDCRSASRSPYWPNSSDDIVGFRVARTIP